MSSTQLGDLSPERLSMMEDRMTVARSYVKRNLLLAYEFLRENCQRAAALSYDMRKVQ
jgi:hypothetical protein